MTRPIEEWLSQPGGIAERLRAARLRAQLTGAQLAEANGWPQSKISKVENGRQTPTVADIHAWMATVGAAAEADEIVDMLEDLHTRHQSWRRRLRSGQAAVQAGYTDLIRDAKVVRDFAFSFFPSMIQTAEYARYPLLKAVRLLGHPESDVAAAIAARMQRQQFLYDLGKRFEFLIDESVLRRLVCPPEVLRGQLDRLQGVIGLPNVRVGILPLAAQPLTLVPENSFTIVDEMVLVETTGKEDPSTDEHQREVHETALALWWAVAVESEDARRLIVEAGRRLPQAA